MLTIKKVIDSLDIFPASSTWYLTELAEARGKQALFTQQALQKLKALREHAIIESAVSSNRIEGVEVDDKRVGTVIFGRRMLKDRDEEEVRGYRKALDLIHNKKAKLKITEKNIKDLHRLVRGGIWDAGKYKEKDGDIIEHLLNGRQRVRFKTVKANKTPVAMNELIGLWGEAVRPKQTQPLVALAAFNLDFLCVHPFRDGNGRVSRLLLLLQCYHLGFEVGRYISLERIIEENKERYYETLEQSSMGWHEGKADPWPYVNFVLFVLREAYREFALRVEGLSPVRGEKAEAVVSAIQKMPSEFRVADLKRACPGVGVDHIRKILARLKKNGKIECLSRGKAAVWKRR